MTASPPLVPGAIIADRFALVRPLGRGGMGEVWEAEQLNLGRKVALKVLLPHVVTDKDALARFAREARVASTLRHPNAVEVYDYGESPVPFIAMELLQGHPMRDIVDVGLPPPPLERSLAIAIQVADVLLVAHDIGLVHRDLKPENVFLERTSSGEDRAVVVDFGLSFINHDANVGRMTAVGMVVGTPEYLSPEQASGKPVGRATDVYAFGCMLYELLTTKTPFAGGDAGTIIAKQMFVLPAPPSEGRMMTWPRRLEELVMSMLRKEPSDRPGAEKVLEELRAIADRKHERARGPDAAVGRAARMISTVAAPTIAAPVTATVPVSIDSIRVGIVGSIDPSLEVAFAVNGLASTRCPPGSFADCDVVLAIGLDEAAVRSLRAQTSLPLLADVPKGDMHRVTALLRAGIDDVLIAPVRAEDAARKLKRATKARSLGR